MNRRKIYSIALLLIVFVVGIVGGYLYFSKIIPGRNSTSDETLSGTLGSEDFFTLRIYYPIGNTLQIEERRLPKTERQMTIAEATIEAYLRGPIGTTTSSIPRGAKLNGLYRGADKILYVDLSDEFRRKFQGDVFSEFLLLKGLYESLISNVEDIQDIKILIEGKEAETLGGHFSIMYPLKELVSYEYR